MSQYKILIIDDEIEKRQVTFEKFFENKWDFKFPEEFKENCGPKFSVTYPKNYTAFKTAVKKEKFDAVFLDVIYEKNGWENYKLNQILGYLRNNLPNNLPIFVYSSNWRPEILQEVNDAFLDVFENITPKRYYLFNDFLTIVNNACVCNDKGEFDLEELKNQRLLIYKVIANNLRRINIIPFAGDSQISIMHLSDLQFGDKKTTQHLVGMIGNIIHSVDKTKDEHNIKGIDLVIITGDISMSGKEEEYNEAEIQLTSLFKRLWPTEADNYKNRIIIIPGNHDFDVNYCMLNYLKPEYVMEEIDGKLTKIRKIDFVKMSEQLMNRTEKYNYASFGLQAYRNFAYRLTRDDVYIKNSGLNFVNDKYIDWGIRFICLNSIYNINADKTNMAGINPKEVEDMLQGVAKYKDDNILSIVLSHHTTLLTVPDEIPDCEHKQIKSVLDGLITGENCKLIIGGHRHKNDSRDEKTSQNTGYKIIEAASLRVEEKSDGYNRGFKIHILNKEFGRVSKLISKEFEFSKIDGQVVVRGTEEYNFLE